MPFRVDQFAATGGGRPYVSLGDFHLAQQLREHSAIELVDASRSER